jgi:RNA polymerase sigma factor (sigma-70 family)
MSVESTPTQEMHTLYSEHHSWLRGWLRKKLGNAFDAADLAHDTYVRILATGSAPAPDQSRRFLTQIANGLVIDMYRRRQIEASYLEAVSLMPEPQVPSEETRLLIIETLIEIDTLLHRLPAKTRMALLLYKLDGLSYQEIAVQLQVSVSSVQKYITSALMACYDAIYTEN